MGFRVEDWLIENLLVYPDNMMANLEKLGGLVFSQRTMLALERMLPQRYWIEINRLENTGDRNHRRTLAKLFSGEFKTIEVLKLKDIVEALEHGIDAFESVANIIEQIAVKES